MPLESKPSRLRLILVIIAIASCGTSRERMFEAPKAMPPFALIWPMNNPRVTEFFGWRKRRMHEGIDFKARKGDAIYSAGDGRVIFAGKGLRGYGNMILIQHAGPWSTLYGHLSVVGVKKGQQVLRGQNIGKAGSTGRSTGPHLHFEVRYGSDPVDPMIYLPTKIEHK